MTSELSFELKGDLATAVTDEKAPTVTPATDGIAGIEKIYQMIQDPEVPVADISRVIALEIVNVMKKMSPKDVLDRGVGPSQRDLNDQVKAYRELQRTLTESDALSKKDVLNLDGEKFKFVFSQLIQLFRQALDDSGIDTATAQNVMLQCKDLVARNEGNLRSELNKIGTGR